MTTKLDPGTTLAATTALQQRRGTGWSDEQVAYLIALAYSTGRRHGAAEDHADMVACWARHLRQPPAQTAEQLVQERLAAMEGLYGPPTYRGGPVPVWEVPA